MTVDGHQDRFDEAPERDTNSIGIGSGLEFRPFAMISGHAYVGWVRVQMVNGESPPFGALTLAVDLTYTLLGATKFTLQAERDVEYSAVQESRRLSPCGHDGFGQSPLRGDMGRWCPCRQIPFDVWSV